MRRPLLALVVVAVVLGAAALVSGLPGLATEATAIPTTKPSTAPLDVRVHTRGELSARKTMGVSAPPIGATMQILTLAPSGALVKKDDVIIRFDKADQEFALEQARSDLAEAEQELVKLDADSKVQAANDDVALLKARFAVRMAELEVSGNEFVGAIKAKQNLLALEQARRQLAQLQDDAQAHADTGQAARAVLVEKREKARLAMQFAERNIASLDVVAPIDGLVIVKENRGAAGGFFFSGMSLPEFREGDPVQPGTTVADIVDVSTIELKAKVGETDRASLDGHGERARAPRRRERRGAAGEDQRGRRAGEPAVLGGQHRAPVRDRVQPVGAERAAAAGHDRPRRGRRDEDQRQPARAAAGALREERQDGGLRARRRRLHRPAGEGRPPHREPRGRRRALAGGGGGAGRPGSRRVRAAGGVVAAGSRAMSGARGERLKGAVLHVVSDGRRGIETMRAHKLRSLLTMLGMIFGVAAVVSMMSIGAGAQQQVLAFIEQLGVRNLIVEAKEATDFDAYQKVRKISPGLTERDLRVIEANVPGISRASMRKRFAPAEAHPEAACARRRVVFGVSPGYREIAAPAGRDRALHRRRRRGVGGRAGLRARRSARAPRSSARAIRSAST